MRKRLLPIFIDYLVFYNMSIFNKDDRTMKNPNPSIDSIGIWHRNYVDYYEYFVLEEKRKQWKKHNENLRVPNHEFPIRDIEHNIAYVYKSVMKQEE